MIKRALFIGVILGIVFGLVFIGLVCAETTNSDILDQIKKGSTGVAFTDNGFGGAKINVNSQDNNLVYKDLQGNSYTITGLSKGSQLELDSKGNLIKADITTSKSLDLVLGGNIKANIPANSKLVGSDGKNFDITLAPGAGVTTAPASLFPDKNSGDSLVNYKLSQKSNVKFPDFNFQEGTISHNGKYFVLKGGNTAVVNSVSLYSLGKDGDNPIFFDSSKVSPGLKSGYSVVDFKKMIIKNIGGDGKTQTIMIRPGNPIALVGDASKLGFKAGPGGQVNLQGKDVAIYPYVKGDFIMKDGILYLSSKDSNLVGSFDKQTGKNDLVAVDISLVNADGSVRLRDKDGNALGLMVRQGQNGWPQIKTEIPLSPENPNPPVQKGMPAWQHNPDDSPLPRPQFTMVSNTKQTQIQNPVSSDELKKQFLIDIYHAQTSGLVQFATGKDNLGQLLQSEYPDLYNKHFARGSMTSYDEVIADYKALIANEAKKYGQGAVNTLAGMMQENHPDLYDKYAAALGFPKREIPPIKK